MEIDQGLIIAVAIGAFFVGVTGLAIYTSFGPPSRELSDPFDDHED